MLKTLVIILGWIVLGDISYLIIGAVAAYHIFKYGGTEENEEKWWNRLDEAMDEFLVPNLPEDASPFLYTFVDVVCWPSEVIPFVHWYRTHFLAELKRGESEDE